jgi:hypothetical protein
MGKHLERRSEHTFAFGENTLLFPEHSFSSSCCTLLLDCGVTIELLIDMEGG